MNKEGCYLRLKLFHFASRAMLWMGWAFVAQKETFEGMQSPGHFNFQIQTKLNVSKILFLSLKIRCCDMTLEVLRKNTEIILTILEVLLYDPLYSWTLSADRVQKVQPGVKNKLPSANSGIEPTQTEEIKGYVLILLFNLLHH